jgi:hypothetical protein
MSGATLHGATHGRIVPTPTLVGQSGIPRHRRHSPRWEPEHTRGDEYNLALGNRRAIATKAYLAAHGVNAEPIETISYGEERPVDPRHTPVAWAMNRNAQFLLLTPAVVLPMP